MLILIITHPKFAHAQLVNIDWGVEAKELMFKPQSDPHSYVHRPSRLKVCSAKGGKPHEKKNGLSGKKRKYETAAKKKERLSAEEMLICVVNFLRNKVRTCFFYTSFTPFDFRVTY